MLNQIPLQSKENEQPNPSTEQSELIRAGLAAVKQTIECNPSAKNALETDIQRTLISIRMKLALRNEVFGNLVKSTKLSTQLQQAETMAKNLGLSTEYYEEAIRIYENHLETKGLKIQLYRLAFLTVIIFVIAQGFGNQNELNNDYFELPPHAILALLISTISLPGLLPEAITNKAKFLNHKKEINPLVRKKSLKPQTKEVSTCNEHLVKINQEISNLLELNSPDNTSEFKQKLDDQIKNIYSLITSLNLDEDQELENGTIPFSAYE